MKRKPKVSSQPTSQPNQTQYNLRYVNRYGFTVSLRYQTPIMKEIDRMRLTKVGYKIEDN